MLLLPKGYNDRQGGLIIPRLRVPSRQKGVFFIGGGGVGVTPAIAFDALSKTGDPDSQTSYTWSHTCSALGARGLIVITGTSGDPDGVTYNGVSMTKVFGPNTGGLKNSYYNVWALDNPTTGTNSIVVDMTTNNGWGEMIAMSFVGVNQTVASMTANWALQTADPRPAAFSISQAVASATGEIVMDATFINQELPPHTYTVGALQTSRLNFSSEDGDDHCASTEPGAASVTMSWTASPTTFGDQIAGAIKPP